MSLYTKFVANVFFPLHEKLKKHDTVSIRKQLEESQWLSTDKLLALQNDKLQQFLSGLYINNTFVKKLFDNNKLSPSDIKTAADLSKLPFMTKSVIKENFEELLSKNAKSVSKFSTGGSSGNPLLFLLGKERVSHDVAEKWRATRWWDVDIGDTEIVAWGSPIELNSQDKVKAIRDKFLRTHLIPAFDLSDASVMTFLDEIKSKRPKMLFGYPSVFAMLAKKAIEKQIDMSKCGIKVVFVTSERLYDYQRQDIEKAFNAPVANGYGGRDAGFIAHECPKGNLHVSAEDIVVEIVGDDLQPLPDGEEGEIVVTHLATSDFPFIRYRTGDIASYSKRVCGCGRGLPILENIQGRSTDFVYKTDGTKMHGLSLIYVLREVDGIEEFKITQHSLGKVDVEVVPTTEMSSAIEHYIVDGLKQRLGDSVDVQVFSVAALTPEKSGKYRYVICKVE
ncbi:phenylacetate--CoA ligase family protein [Brumicola nitratireducens]|uniref:Putative CapK protein n=1 Tax=Glaciecola nitratireducens (strain JCM 12485 / KCTC 12276 / FR1064) TaxID=1085623 RepID=G4QI41_GLANF|nr:AMP-binding protein [Glaciecola nitratireducens]AEP30655.1 putative CapK protein [Glaciecola nitratireducens FR1064]